MFCRNGYRTLILVDWKHTHTGISFIPWHWPRQTGRRGRCKDFQGRGRRFVPAATWVRYEGDNLLILRWFQREEGTPAPAETSQTPPDWTIEEGGTNFQASTWQLKISLSSEEILMKWKKVKRYQKVHLPHSFQTMRDFLFPSWQTPENVSPQSRWGIRCLQGKRWS